MNENAPVAPRPSAPLRDAGISAAELGAGQDSDIRALMARPFTILEPANWTSPYLFTSPHSGNVYAPSFIGSSSLKRLALRRSEDAFVDEIFGIVPEHGAHLLAARFPRAYVDVNRDAGEIDPGMFEAGHPRPFGLKTARVSAGLGVIPKVVRDGMEIYDKPLPIGEAAFRLEAFYRPYHAALTRLLAATKERFGMAILVDCHSMPPAANGQDVVIGDRHGNACSPELSDRIETALRAAGFSVARNNPYAGGYTTSHYGDPAREIHAVQIELNRGLYLIEKKMEKSGGFTACKAAVEGFVANLMSQPGL
jgi:N-formylglutamate amidohydrolase